MQELSKKLRWLYFRAKQKLHRIFKKDLKLYLLSQSYLLNRLEELERQRDLVQKRLADRTDDLLKLNIRYESLKAEFELFRKQTSIEE